MIAPLERVRILKQTKHINKAEFSQIISDSSLTNMRKIIADSGVSALWRGNSPLIMKSILQLSIKIIFYDKFKQYFMPYDSHKYSGMQYFFRAACSSICCMSFSFFFSYTFDIIHTRASADMSLNGKQRIYSSTFECFNKTHIDEGSYALFKGSTFAISSSLMKACLTLPLYDLIRRRS
jgi:hypothetical protein